MTRWGNAYSPGIRGVNKLYYTRSPPWWSGGCTYPTMVCLPSGTNTRGVILPFYTGIIKWVNLIQLDSSVLMSYSRQSKSKNYRHYNLDLLPNNVAFSIKTLPDVTLISYLYLSWGEMSEGLPWRVWRDLPHLHRIVVTRSRKQTDVHSGIDLFKRKAHFTSEQKHDLFFVGSSTLINCFSLESSPGLAAWRGVARFVRSKGSFFVVAFANCSTVSVYCFLATDETCCKKTSFRFAFQATTYFNKVLFITRGILFRRDGYLMRQPRFTLTCYARFPPLVFYSSTPMQTEWDTGYIIFNRYSSCLLKISLQGKHNCPLQIFWNFQDCDIAV